MKLIKACVRQFIPMEYAGNKGIDIEFDSNVLCLIGNNGSGKSMLMGEITPFPSVSTLYAKGGYKEIHIEHKGIPYVCSSRFNGRQGEHSFLKDGVELNKSKTSGVQQELCRTELGITPAIRTIIGGVVNFCKMPCSQRKSFLLSCYPSDLSFVLVHFKNIVSQVRATRSNLKMLNARLLELKQDDMPDGAYVAMRLKHTELGNLGLDIQKVITTYESEIAHIRNDPSFRNDVSFGLIRDYRERIATVKHKAMVLRATDQAVFSGSPHAHAVELRSEKNHLEGMLSDVSDRIQAAISEIDRLKELSETVSEERISKHVAKIDQLIAKSNDLHFDKALPLLEESLVDSINRERVKDNCSVFVDMDTMLRQPTEYANMVDELDRFETELSEHNIRHDALLKELKRMEDGLHTIKTAGFREGCKLACAAREKNSGIVVEMAFDTGKLRGMVSAISDRKRYLVLSIEALRMSVEPNTAAIPWLRKLSDIVERTGIDLSAHLDTDLYGVLSTAPMRLYNLLHRIMHNSRIATNCGRVNTELDMERTLLASIRDARKDNRELLGGLTVTQSTTLAELQRQHLKLVQALADTETLYGKYATLAVCANTIDTLRESYSTVVVPVVLHEKESMLTSIVERLRTTYGAVMDERAELRNTLKEKEAIKIRLHDEILPSINEMDAKLRNITLLEKALSPTSGLPHTYMVRFLNQVIEYANQALSVIWNYDMVLGTLAESKALEYEFNIRIRHRKPLKDISMLSTGQREAVDLAWSLALLHTMGLGAIYPIKLDEIDAGMVPEHRAKLLELFDTLLHSGGISQMLLVSHASSLSTAFADSQLACLSTDGIVVPAEYNRNIKLHT